MLTACGGEAGDLLALEISGGFQDEPVRLTVTEDGRGSCDQGELEPIPGERLIEARDVERDLETLAEDGTSFGDPGGSSDEAAENRAPQEADERRLYVARTRAGTVRWVEGTPELPEVLPRAALLAQELQDDLCGA